MKPKPFTLLLVAPAGSQLHLPEGETAGRFFTAQASLEAARAWLEQNGADAVLIQTQRCTGEMIQWIEISKKLRPRTQFYLILDRNPPARTLIGLLHAGCQDVFELSAISDWTTLLDSVEERIRFVQVRQLERLHARNSLHYAGLVGESPQMLRVYDQVRRAAGLACPVLILGETGTGKGLVAHAIHALSGRNGKPFVTVDCGCLAPTLIESELYGVARGAYTGATVDRSGLVQAAQQGTLFLDEIGELPLALQPKLLRLLEEGEVRRLGSQLSTPVDIRVISATSRELESLISSEHFRADLFYRLNVVAIEVPPLRQRPQDITPLARHFAARHQVHGGPVTISSAALQVLAEYRWPGNVRELKNTIEAAIASSGGSEIHLTHLPSRLGRELSEDSGSRAAAVNLKQIEKQAILRALEMAANDKIQAARLLGIGKSTLYRKLKEMSAGGDDQAGPAARYLM